MWGVGEWRVAFITNLIPLTGIHLLRFLLKQTFIICIIPGISYVGEFLVIEIFRILFYFYFYFCSIYFDVPFFISILTLTVEY